ncbi:WD domain-containing protein [Drepanopeziza brunnea f. sp. 'multigermtubi' MB_m1]|uniref:WD domain-containing protein n=1 Tax=Marssonina brunnea f. sp. multigermtubi (strain MB_m1) TaxID=1072389 RepID=K1W845_MARBU|nr:WD domain-containing protein [Drepanopeziza brunnea f. sp. 'multigermtubi' MB_m1]EKD13335.1 WD domain-containing protein [Drepanopeziza brunnea f. sp. 'multigermtubi' MB_m1]
MPPGFMIQRHPAEVVLADQPAPSSPSTSDDPFTPNHPPLPSSTRISAPTPNNLQINQLLNPEHSNPSTSTPSGASRDLQPAETQILGRRQRESSEEPAEEGNINEGAGGPGSARPSSSDHRPKRTRHGSRMRPEGETSNFNGTSRPQPNGSGPSSLHKAALSNSANGTRRSPLSMNGSLSTNGRSSGKQKPTYFGHDREEITRILIQSLTDLGYNSAASSLSQESGYDLESPTVAKFRNAVLEGAWSQAENLLCGGVLEEGGVSIDGDGLTLQDGIDRNLMRFWLRQQKFLELLERRDTGRALMVLRAEITPLYQDTGKLHFLSSLLMCQSTEDLKNKAAWDGAEGSSRHQLLSKLSRFMSPSVMLPEHRLAVLLHQVKENQIGACLYHNTSASPSLYQDHNCDRNQFPLHTVMELDQHSGEVWQVKFSNDGERLASCGKDGTCIIYAVGTFDVIQCLAKSESGIASFAWSPDDSMIVTCSTDQTAVLWDTHTGQILKQLPRFGEPASSCVWAPDGQSFVTGCLDRERNLCQWSLHGELIYDWGQPHRIQDLAVSPNGHYLVAMDHETHIHVYNFVTRELEYEIDMKANMSSVSISQNSRYLLVNKTDGEARMIALDTRETYRSFKSGAKGGNFVIRATYGGANESFVIFGSEEGSVYIYHKETGQLIEKLEGHGKASCNAVSWNPANPSMFATAGDDAKVRIWADVDQLEHRLLANSGRPSNGRSS